MAALVTIVQCNTLVVLCSRQLMSPANWDPSINQLINQSEFPK